MKYLLDTLGIEKPEVKLPTRLAQYTGYFPDDVYKELIEKYSSMSAVNLLKLFDK